MAQSGVKPKRKGMGLEAKTFIGKSGNTYLVFKTLDGGYHVFTEAQAKDAAKDCGATGTNTRRYWDSIW